MESIVKPIDYLNTTITALTPFIVITTPITNGLVKRKYTSDTFDIYGTDMPAINDFLKQQDIDAIFVPIADMLVDKKDDNVIQTKLRILLVNNTLRLSYTPDKFERVLKLNSGSIWRPYSTSVPETNTLMGLIYSSKKPNIKDYRMIDTQILTSSNSLPPKYIDDQLIISNEYNMFITDHDNPITLDERKLFITGYVNSNIDTNAVIETFKSVKQDEPIPHDCVKPDNTEEVNWKPVKGKYTALVSTDNPWYVNADKVTPVKQTEHAEYTDYYKPYGSFKPKHQSHNVAMIVDGLQPSSGVECFGQPYRKISNTLFIAMLVIILVQMFIILKR